MNVLVLFLTFLDNLLDGLHLSLCEPTGLWEFGESSGVLDAFLVDKVLEWFLDILYSNIADNFVGSAQEWHSFPDFLSDEFACGSILGCDFGIFWEVVTQEQEMLPVHFKLVCALVHSWRYGITQAKVISL